MLAGLAYTEVHKRRGKRAYAYIASCSFKTQALLSGCWTPCADQAASVHLLVLLLLSAAAQDNQPEAESSFLLFCMLFGPWLHLGLIAVSVFEGIYGCSVYAVSFQDNCNNS